MKINPISKFNTNIETREINNNIKQWEELKLHLFTTLPGPPDNATNTSSTYPVDSDNDEEHPGVHDFVWVIVGISLAFVVGINAMLVILLRRCWHNARLTNAVTEQADDTYRHYSTMHTSQVGLDGQRQQQSSHPSRPKTVDEWELPVTSVKLGPLLGSGAFGKVVKGRVSKALLELRGMMADGELCLDQADKCHLTVAVKMLQDECDWQHKQEFLKEIKLMKNIGHHRHVVSMLGCCTLRDPVCLVVEHMASGDLLGYLKHIRHRIDMNLRPHNKYVNENPEMHTSMDLLSFAKQIALGMDFLSSKGYVHRDLAARNVLVDSNRRCKIGDFGLTRFMYDDAVYVNRKGGRLPVKWMSIEAIFDQSFSTASDVWSFGIVLFEVVTLGGTPYPTIPSQDLLKELQSGYRMDRPDNCSEEIYHMMLRCWKEDPRLRPSFKTLTDWLENLMTDSPSLEYIDMGINLNRDVYQIEEIVENEDIIRYPINSVISDHVTWVDETPAPSPKASSDDSGYTPSKKSSVSSGESGAVASSTSSGLSIVDNEEHRQLTMDTRSEAFTEMRLLDTVDSITVLNAPERPKVMLKRVSFNGFDEMIEDDVFEKGLNQEIPMSVSRRLRRRVDDIVCITSPQVIRKCAKPTAINYVSQNLTRRNSDSVICMSKFEIKDNSSAGLKCSNPSELFNTNSMVKSKSDSELVKFQSNGNSYDLQIQRFVMKFPTRRHQTKRKQRRIGVYTPPTLALNNDLYFEFDSKRKRIRQEPPATQIHRKTIPVVPVQLDDKDKDLTPILARSVNSKLESINIQKKPCFLKHCVRADVHRPEYDEPSSPRCKVKIKHEFGRSFSPTDLNVPFQYNTSSQTKVFVRKNPAIIIYPGTSISSCGDYSNRVLINKHLTVPHKYTDFKEVLRKTTSCDTVTSDRSCRKRTSLEHPEFGGVQDDVKTHQRSRSEDGILSSYYELEKSPPDKKIGIFGTPSDPTGKRSPHQSSRVRNDSGLPKSPGSLIELYSSVSDSDRVFFPDYDRQTCLDSTEDLSIQDGRKVSVPPLLNTCNGRKGRCFKKEVDASLQVVYSHNVDHSGINQSCCVCEDVTSDMDSVVMGTECPIATTSEKHPFALYKVRKDKQRDTSCVCVKV